jgi:hypothetical protein
MFNIQNYQTETISEYWVAATWLAAERQPELYALLAVL